ncbi:MAG TPA: hypothetical protein VI685_13965 [Candidatus Angelobacter sp.]
MTSSIMTYFGSPLVLMVVAVMVYRRLYREFPFFLTYLLTVVIAGIMRVVFFHYRMVNSYFYTYWITEAAEVLLAFLVLYEVFLVRLFPGFNITSVYRWLFPVIGVTVLALTAWMFFSAPSTGASRAVVIIGELTFALSFMQVAVLAFFCALMLFMSREWRRHELGIAAGFGIYGAVKLLITLNRANQSYASTAWQQLPTVAYAVAAVIWLVYLSRSDPEPEETPITEEMVEKVEQVYGQILEMFRKKRWRL